MTIPSFQGPDKRVEVAKELSTKYPGELWFHECCLKVPISILNALNDPPLVRGNDGVYWMAQMMRGGRVKQEDAYRLMQLWVKRNHIQTRMDLVKKLVDWAYYSKKTEVAMETLIRQAMFDLLGTGDTRLVGEGKGVITVFTAIQELHRTTPKNAMGMVNVSLTQLESATNKSRPTVISAIKRLQELGVIQWFPGTRHTPSQVELIPE